MDSNTSETPSAAARNGRRRRLVIALAIMVLIAGAIISGRWLVHRLTHVTTDAAYVKADIAEVAPELAGRVVEILVHEGEAVRAGQTLLRTEAEDWQLREEQAAAKAAELEKQVGRREAVLERTRASVVAVLAAARAGLGASRQQLAKAEAALSYLEAQERRLAALLDERAVPRSRWDEVHAAAEAGRADVAAAQQGVAAAEAKLAEAEAARLAVEEAAAGLAETKAGLDQANAALAQVRWARGRTEVRAPIAGLVARVFVRTGDFAVPGRPVVAIYDPATRYVEARFEETRVARLRVGQAAALEVDALPNLTLRGKVRRIAPAAAQEFALIPRDVTAGEFTKVTQRVPVEFDVEELDAHPELVPGLSVEVAVRKQGS